MTTAQAGIPTTPTTEELVDRARAALQRCGVDPHMAYLTWRSVPAPVRGGLIKRLGELLTEHKADLADLITLEVGKIRPKPWARSRR